MIRDSIVDHQVKVSHDSIKSEIVRPRVSNILSDGAKIHWVFDNIVIPWFSRRINRVDKNPGVFVAMNEHIEPFKDEFSLVWCNGGT